MKSTLLKTIQRMIAQSGPMDVATYMQLCLSHPEFGYYRTAHAIGRKADFITAPEVSQLFGEMIGVWVIDIWQQMDEPAAFHLVEAGPGRGTLMSDVLRTIGKASPNCLKGLEVLLIEINPHLKKEQKQRLVDHPPPIQWQESLTKLNDKPFILIANEFLDALPIRQYLFDGNAWGERVIGLEAEQLVFGLKPSEMKPTGLPIPKTGDVLEVCPMAQSLIHDLADRMKTKPAAALFLDYGHLNSGYGDTLQAIKAHQFVDPLAMPGESDLTAHVDFAVLSQIARHYKVETATTTQGLFLLNMGLLERAGQLGAGLSREDQGKIRNDVERLAGYDQMGNLFKAMTLASKGIKPHGFQ